MSTSDAAAGDGPAATQPMPVKVSIYHNNEARFLPYEDGQQLTAVASHRLDVPSTDPVTVAEWAFRTFNADLDLLETERQLPGGETTFLAACVYRLLGRRSLSVGDVVEIQTGPCSQWLACDPLGWRPIGAPTYICGAPLSAAMVYQRLAEQRHLIRESSAVTGARSTVGRSRRVFTVTAQISVDADADLGDPFNRGRDGIVA